MAYSPEEPSPLQIRCPSCSQKFQIDPSLKGRVVECGACESQFLVSDDVIKPRKTYVGERHTADLSGFKKTAAVLDADGEGSPHPVNYREAPRLSSFEPVPPQRVIGGIIGVVGMVLMGFFLASAGGAGGSLEGVPTNTRLMLAGFAALVGAVLVIYANPRAPIKATLVSLILAGGLCAVPFVFKQGVRIPGSDGPALAGAPRTGPAPLPDLSASPEAALRKRVGIEPLEAEMSRMKEAGGGMRAYGIWLKNLPESNKLLVRDFIIRATGASPDSHPFPRGEREVLMVLSGVTSPIEEVAAELASLGELVNDERTTPILRDLSVIELRVDNSIFLEGPIEKLSNKADPAFYDLNLRELKSIELERVAKAVKRLAEADPKIYRTDVTRRLIELLDEKNVDFHADICRALIVWSERPGPAGEAALKVMERLRAAKSAIPRDVAALAVKEKISRVVPILDEQWMVDPLGWEPIYGNFGPEIEPTVIRRLPEATGALRLSAIRLLGKIGGKDALDALENVKSVRDPELTVVLESAKTAIRKRIGN